MAEGDNPKLEVTAAKSTVDGLLIQANGFWCGVDSQRWLLEIPICILIDSYESNGYFANNFSVYWPGDLAENNAPHMMTGGTDNLVVACLLEEYFVLNTGVEDVDLSVPSAMEAAERLPVLRVARHRRDGSFARRSNSNSS